MTEVLEWSRNDKVEMSIETGLSALGLNNQDPPEYGAKSCLISRAARFADKIDFGHF